MPNPQGTPIWYELQTDDPDAATSFYDAVIGWRVGPRPAGEMDYRMIDADAGGGEGGQVGGVMRLTDEMKAGGAGGGWMVYVGVDDVDASAEAIGTAGGRILMGPWDIPGVGRMAVAADPQGIPFYIMRGATGGTSTAFDRTGMGRCSWNELVTPDQTAANAFYARVFGWTYPDRMALPGDMGDYIFVHVCGQVIGATMTAGQSPPGWRFYFRAPDVERAAASVVERGGAVLMGPVDVPGGDRIILASDPQGVTFGVVGPGEQA